MKTRFVVIPFDKTASKISSTIKLCPATFGFATDIYIYIYTKALARAHSLIGKKEVETFILER
jgi:hypothetical protein